MKNEWKQVWNNRKLTQESSALRTLIKMNGFDGGAGAISENSWRKYVNNIYKIATIQHGDTIFEIGCGCGAFLYCFHELGHVVSGIDYSQSLIEASQKFIPNMTFKVLEASEIDTNDKYDIILSNSVFQYFPNLEYSKRVLLKMIKKSKRIVLILDVPDFLRRVESENLRKVFISKKEYEEKYMYLNHAYYPKDWFIEVLKESECKLEFFEQNIINYGNSNFRYNVLIKINNKM
jgi:trans-aconitate methyltransferase